MKFSAVEKKRQCESDAAATTAEDIPATAPPPPSASTFIFESGNPGPAFVPETQSLCDENRDLKHQLSVLSTQLASFQASMSSQIGSLSAQVINLSHQVAKLSASAPVTPTKTYSSAGTLWTYLVPATGPPPPPPAKPTLKLSLQKKQSVLAPEPTSQAQNLPKGTSYANVTAVDSEAKKTFAVVSHNKPKPQKKGPLKPLYNPNDQKVVVQVHLDTLPQTSVQMTWQYLQMANHAVCEYQKDLDYCFIRCHVTMKQNLVLQTSTKTQGTDYLPYLEVIKTQLEEEGKLCVTAIDGEPRWSKFLLHGVSTLATMEEVAIFIQQSYPGVLKLAQTPR